MSAAVEQCPLTAADLAGTAGRISAAIESVIRGKPDAVRLILTVLLAAGHVLIEDVPGVGKTMLAKINRAPAKTQSALLECMEEQQVTVDGPLDTLTPVADAADVRSDDGQALAVPVLAHRLLPAGTSRNRTPEAVVADLVQRLPAAMRRLGSQT